MIRRPAGPVAEVRVAVRRALQSYVGRGESLTVACSGGADSLALASAVAFEAPKQELRAGAVTVDHGLAPDSGERAHDLAVRLRGLGLDPVHTVTVSVADAGGGGPENRARDARYGALRTAGGAGWVVLGHTLDDQAETVLLGLGRGSGPRSIAGMSPVNRPWLRPLLGIRRATTRAGCAAEGLEVWDDPHNADPRFTRVRLRREVLPLLEDVLQDGVAAALARTAGLLREDADALDALAAAVALDDPPRADGLSLLSAAVRRRVLRRWLAPAGPLTSAHLHAVDALLTDWHGQGAVALPGGWAASRVSGRLHLQPGAGPHRRHPTAAHPDVPREP